MEPMGLTGLVGPIGLFLLILLLPLFHLVVSGHGKECRIWLSAIQIDHSVDVFTKARITVAGHQHHL